MLNRVQYQQSPFPDFDSEEGKKLAIYFNDTYRMWRDASSELRTKVWPACDRAFLCKRTLPKNKGMHWVDRGDIGESDLWDATRMLAETFLLNLMPRDESWVQMIPYNSDNQSLYDRFRDYLLYKLRECDFRGSYGKHITQALVRGTSAIRREWMQIERAMSQGGAAQAMFANDPSQFMPGGMTAEDMMGELNEYDPESFASQNSPVQPMLDKAFESVFNGPAVTCMDMQDVFLDPSCKSQGNGDVPMAIMVYKTIEELHGAIDENGAPVYSNLDKLQTYSLDQIWSDQTNRSDTSKLMGINPAGTSMGRKGQYVPVLVFHRQVERFEGQQWVDSYFYLATSPSGSNSRLIRSHINESDKGHRSVFIDCYHDHYSGSAYGVSAIEKSLPDWHKKNVASALTLQAQVACVFPAMNVIAGMAQDDGKVSNAPGSYNFIAYKPQIGPNFMAPVPTPNSGAVLGIQTQQYLGQKILGQMGANGSALSLDPSRNITQNKTATQVNTESTSSSVGRDNLLEKFSIHSLEPLVQAMVDDASQFAKEELTDFVYQSDGKYSVGRISQMLLEARKKVIVTGYHGYQNKLAEIDNCNKALQAITQGNALQYLGAPGPLLLREVIFKLLSRFGIKDLERFKVTDGELILSTPEGQQAVMETSQAAMQQAMEMTGVPPEAAQMILQAVAQIVQMQTQQAQGEGGPGPQQEAA